MFVKTYIIHQMYILAGVYGMSNLLYNRDIISTKDLSLEQIELVLDTAAQIKKKPLKMRCEIK